MPNVTIFAPASYLEVDEARFHHFMRECTDACTTVLRAELDKVHIIFVPTLPHFAGKDAYVEVKVRTSPHRTKEVMAEFMSAVEESFKRYFGRLPRIRCFAYSAENIFARN